MKKPPLQRRALTKPAANPLIDALRILTEVEKNHKSGELKKALAQCQMLLKQHPNYVGALHNIGLIFAKLGDRRNAIHNLAYAEVLDPQNISIKLDLAHIYLEVDSVRMALLILNPLAELHRENIDVQVSLGLALERNRECEKAIKVYDNAIYLNPDNRLLWKRKAVALRETGLIEEASIAMHRSVKIGQADISSVGFLSELPKSLVSVNVSKLFDKVEKLTFNKTKKYLTRRDYAKMSILLSESNFEDGLKVIKKANDIKFEEVFSIYNKDKLERRDYMSVLKQYAVQKPNDIQNDSFPTSVFIFGPSRSGKSTLENLLGGLPSVERGYESSIVKDAARRTSSKAGLPRRDFLSELPPQTEKLFREFYLEELSGRICGKKSLTITTPGRIIDTYRLAQSIPNTRFIFIRRNVEDTVFRIYTYLYRTGNAHSYNIDAAREYVNWYYEAQDKLSELLPEITMTVSYEDMVKNPVAVAKSVQEFCNIKGEVGTLPDIGDDRGFAVKFKGL